MEFDAFEAASRYAASAAIRFWNDEFYRWNGRAYTRIGATAVKRSICRHLRSPVRRSAVNEMLDLVKCAALVGEVKVPCWLSQRRRHPAHEILAVKNGLLYLPGVSRGRTTLLEHTPSFFTLNGLHYDYEEEASCPHWERFVTEIFDGDAESIRTLQEWFGYVLLPDTRQQKLLMIVGPKRSGKGTVARIVRELLGEDNVAAPTIRSLSGAFGLWGLVGKTLAIVPDANPDRPSSSLVELIKSLTGEDALDIERKNLAPMSNVRLTTRLMVIANQLPAMIDHSGALAQRMILLQTRRSWAGMEDTRLTDRLLKELPGILLWSIRGWRRLRRRGYFRQPQSSRHLAETYGTVGTSNGKKDMNPARRLVTNGGPSGKRLLIQIEVCIDNRILGHGEQ